LAQYTFRQALRTAPLYPLALSLHGTNDGIFLAIGGSSSHINLYTSLANTIDFTLVATLKGHEDWVRGLDFTTLNSDIYLASASQDRYIRLWKISQSQNDIDLYPFFANSTNTSFTSLGGDSYPFTLGNRNYNVTFSALLPGHDDWVFTVRFHPSNPEILLSSSADASLIIWRPEPQSGIWIPETRLGEVSSLKGATTAQGSSGGFSGSLWRGEKDVLSWGKTGAWRHWTHSEEGKWIQKAAVGGPIRSVKGISWDSLGRYLLSVRYLP
jgi:elongator complex protein 2